MKKSQKQAQRAQARGVRREKVKKGVGMKSFAPVAVNELQQFSGGSRNGRRSWRFSGRELVGDINGSASFATTKYSLNPGLEGSFPWLSGEADKWEQYRFHRLRYCYVPRCASTTVGSVLLSPDYNVRDRSPSTEVEAADTFGAIESSAWGGFHMDLDVSAMFPLGPRKFIRSSNVTGDMNLYDVGALYVSTTGEADASLIGKLWAEYEVEFFIPQNSPSDDSGPSRITFTSNSDGGDQTLTTAVDANLEFDAPPNDPLGIGSPVAGLFTPAAGTYLVNCTASFNDSAAEPFLISMALYKSDSIITVSSARVQTTTSQRLNINIFAIISCNGSDTVKVVISPIGAAGTLTVVHQQAMISFQPA
jgi:hypothetical protein